MAVYNIDLSQLDQTFSEVVTSSDPIDLYKFSANGSQSSKFEINGDVGIQLYHDVNRDGVLQANEMVLVTNGTTTRNLSNGLGVSVMMTNNNGQVSQTTKIQGIPADGDNYLEVFSKGTNPNYTLKVSSSSTLPTPTPPPTNQTIIGTPDMDSLFGRDGNDTIQGLAGNDSIFGGSGDDLINGGTGDDNIFGGSGVDTARFSGSSSNYQINMSPKKGTISGPDGSDLLIDIEKLQFDDRIIDIVASLSQTIIGTPDIDNLFGGDGNDTIQGLAGNDIIIGGLGDDLINAGTGNDNIDGSLGVDTAQFSGSSSNYQINMSGTTGTISGPDGIDLLAGIEKLQFDDRIIDLVASSPTPTPTPTPTPQPIIGTSGKDVLIGTGNGDIVQGLGGDDTLKGLDGNDTLQGDAGNDKLMGGNGNDSLFGGSGNDILNGNAGADILNGDAGNDKLMGGVGNDRLLGGSGNDILDGGAGADILNGGAGNDQLYGKGGKDIFVLELNSGTDTIADFNLRQDLIDLSNGLTFADLKIVQGIGTRAANTEIYMLSTNEFLASVSNIQAATITSTHFV